MDKLVRDWMTADPITVSRSDSAARARALMERADVRHLLVTNSAGAMLGIVTWGDLAEAWPSPFSTLEPREVRELMQHILVDEIMTAEVIEVDPETTIAEAANLMFEHSFGALPIVEDGRAVGILTNSDLLQGLVRLLAKKD